MKRMFSFLAVLVAALVLVACGVPKKSNKGTENAKYAIEIKSGTYIVARTATETRDANYLALEVKITNKTSKTLSITNKNFGLYDSKKEKVSAEDTVYTSEDEFKMFLFEDVAKDSSVTGYLVFDVSKDEKYELVFNPLTFSVKEGKGDDEVRIAVDPKKYKDGRKDIVNLTKGFIEDVFLDSSEISYSDKLSSDGSATKTINLSDKDSDKKSSKFELVNDINEVKEEYFDMFSESLSSQFFYYEPTEKDVQTFLEAYIEANANYGDIEYSIKSYFPDSAVISVRPEVIDLSAIDIDSITEKFVQDNKGKYSNTEEAQKAAERYILDKVPTMFDKGASLTDGDMNGKKGFEVKLLKNKSGKWEILTDDYGFESLMEVFIGGL